MFRKEVQVYKVLLFNNYTLVLDLMMLTLGIVSLYISVQLSIFSNIIVVSSNFSNNYIFRVLSVQEQLMYRNMMPVHTYMARNG